MGGIRNLSKEDKIKLVLDRAILDKVNDSAWNNSLKRLIAFRDEHGRNPRGSSAGDGLKLFHWYQTQRHKSAKKNSFVRDQKLNLFNFNRSSGPVFQIEEQKT